ncbi:Elongation factor 2 [uncultured archaeon]|nr:Elongation factor 2 [uncultured archaeon]
MARASFIDDLKTIIKDAKNIRNIAICAHIDHGKTTLSDNLLSGAGLISSELAGKQQFMDFDKQEQERGITIYAANVSMIHTVDGKDYAINLIDTPGHVDFGGDVTRAMRAVDGCVVVVCAVEGAMPQTETVLRQALKEQVKPILFINKVDRLIKELKLSPEEVQQRLAKHIAAVNTLIKKYAPLERQADWMVDVNSGKVVFGSAYHNWAISVPFMKKSGVTFKDIFDAVNGGTEKEFAKKAKAYEVLLDAVIHHLPSPYEAQRYRIKKIWTGDPESPEGKSMGNCDPNGPVVGVITNVNVDLHAGSICTVRLFSGTVKEGQAVYLVSQESEERVQQVGVYAGPRRIQLGEISCGNIIAISGLSKAFSGETVCSTEIKTAPFESIKHIFEPVVTKSIEVKDVKNLPKMIELLRQRSREDPTIAIKISESTGETLVSALGELHIDAKVERFLRDRGIDIIVSKPIVIYKESIFNSSGEYEGKSPNKHNKFYVTVSPMPESVRDAMNAGLIEEGKVRKQDVKSTVEELVAAGMDRDEAKKVIDLYKGNILLNDTKGIVQLNEVIELVVQSFHEICDQGPLAGEPVMGLIIHLTDAKLHEDAIHRGPAQVLPAVKGAIKNAMVDAKAALLEPKQILRVDSPIERIGDVMKEIQNRRGQILEMVEESGMTVVKCKLPVAEMFGFESSLKSATGGRGFQSLIDITYEKLPNEFQDRTILAIRKRKGMKEELPRIEVD